MQDPHSPDRRKLLATHGRTIHPKRTPFPSIQRELLNAQYPHTHAKREASRPFTLKTAQNPLPPEHDGGGFCPRHLRCSLRGGYANETHAILRPRSFPTRYDQVRDSTRTVLLTSLLNDEYFPTLYLPAATAVIKCVWLSFRCHSSLKLEDVRQRRRGFFCRYANENIWKIPGSFTGQR
jgi:hypothetical protein